MEDGNLYPPKPHLAEPKSKGSLALTIFSVVLFIMTFLFIFTDEVDFVFQLIIVLIVHEMGHFALMRRYNYKNVRMLFIPLMGAFVQGSKEEYSQKESIYVVAAGPFPGILIGVLLILFAASSQTVWMVDLGLLFIFLNLINLFPLDPLDGGQLFKLMIKRNQDLFLLVFTFVSSLIMIGIGWLMNSWILIVFGFFMGFRVRTIQNQYQLRKELREEEVNFRTTYKRLSNRDFSKIKQVLLEHTPALRNYIENVSEEIAEPLLASQVNSVLVSPIKRDASLFFKALLIFIWVASFLTPFILFFFFSETIQENYEWYLQVLSNQ